MPHAASVNTHRVAQPRVNKSIKPLSEKRVYKCKVCDITLSSAYQKRIHEGGSKHKRVLEAIEARKNNFYPCELCDLHFRTRLEAEAHEHTRGHLRKKRQLALA